MRSWRCLTLAIGAGAEETLISSLHDRGSLGIESREGLLLADFPPGVDVDRLLERIRGDLGPVATALRVHDSAVLPDGRWQERWAESLEPFEIGRRFVVVPGRATAPVRDDRIRLRITPGRAFGTGEHPTTRMCLEMLEEQVTPGSSLLDVGTGSGILAIAGSRLGAEPVVAIDLDRESIEAATVNARANGAEGIAFEVGGLEADRGGPHDLVVANLNGFLLRQQMERLTAVSGRVLIVSGLLLAEEPEVAAAARRSGWRTRRRLADGGWSALELVPGP